MEITEITKLLESDNYVDRFKGEYWLVRTKRDKLQNMLDKYDEGELEFEPNTPIVTLVIQCSTMAEYLSILEERAEIESVNLND